MRPITIHFIFIFFIAQFNINAQNTGIDSIMGHLNSIPGTPMFGVSVNLESLFDNYTYQGIGFNGSYFCVLPDSVPNTSQTPNTIYPNVSSTTLDTLQYQFKITPYRNDFPTNGVTTNDITLISKHILGTASINNPYLQISCDINKDNKITAYDMVLLRRLVLVVDNAFTMNTSWRFIPKDFIFPNPQNAFESVFPESIYYNPFSPNNPASLDFIGIKIGDPSGTVNFTGNSPNNNFINQVLQNNDD